MRSKKKVLIGIVLAALAAAGAALLFWPRPLTLAFYDVDPKLEAQVAKAIEDQARAARVSLRCETGGVKGLDAKSLRGVDALVLYPSRPNAAFAASFRTQGAELAGRYTPPMQRIASAGNRVWALPLLVDSRELAYRKDLPIFAEGLPSQRLVEMGGIGKGLPKGIMVPMILRGGLDDSLIDLAGELALERGGLASYYKLADGASARAGSGSSALLETELGDFTLRDALEPVIEYRKSGLVHPNWLDFKDADANGFVEEGFCAVSVQTLGQHRGIPYQALQAWGSVVASPCAEKGLPVITASILSICETGRGKGSRAFARLAARLSSSEGQTALQAATGLGPAAAAAPGSDVQASTARDAASSSLAVQGLSRDAFVDAKARGAFAEALRQYLRSRF